MQYHTCSACLASFISFFFFFYITNFFCSHSLLLLFHDFLVCWVCGFFFFLFTSVLNIWVCLLLQKEEENTFESLRLALACFPPFRVTAKHAGFIMVSKLKMVFPSLGKAERWDWSEECVLKLSQFCCCRGNWDSWYPRPMYVLGCGYTHTRWLMSSRDVCM